MDASIIKEMGNNWLEDAKNKARKILLDNPNDNAKIVFGNIEDLEEALINNYSYSALNNMDYIIDDIKQKSLGEIASKILSYKNIYIAEQGTVKYKKKIYEMPTNIFNTVDSFFNFLEENKRKEIILYTFFHQSINKFATGGIFDESLLVRMVII